MNQSPLLRMRNVPRAPRAVLRRESFVLHPATRDAASPTGNSARGHPVGLAWFPIPVGPWLESEARGAECAQRGRQVNVMRACRPRMFQESAPGFERPLALRESIGITTGLLPLPLSRRPARLAKPEQVFDFLARATTIRVNRNAEDARIQIRRIMVRSRNPSPEISRRLQ